MSSRNYGMGRIAAPDARDARFRLATVTPKLAAASTRYWRTGPVLDQGPFPHCVGFSWAQFIASAPMMTKLPRYSYPSDLYRSAQDMDEWEGNAYDGTSVRGGVKALQSQGRIAEYLWSTDADEVRRYVLSRGSVVMGTNWYSQMFTPEAHDGYLVPEGAWVGGHAWLVVGFSSKRQSFRLLNSWGLKWGHGGRAWIRMRHMHQLLSEPGAECCSALELKTPTTAAV